MDKNPTQLYPTYLGLRLVQIIHRHGQRAPINDHFLNWDATANEIQPLNTVSAEWNCCQHLSSIVQFRVMNGQEGYYRLDYGLDNALMGIHSPSCHIGELTDVGKATMYQLGQQWRKLYVDKLKYLNEQFQPGEIMARSTEIPRALMSLQSALLGLYPPEYRRDASAKVPISTVIQISTVRESKENMYPSFKCEKWHQLSKLFKMRVKEEYQALRDRIKQHDSLKAMFQRTSHIPEQKTVMTGQNDLIEKKKQWAIPSLHSVYDDLECRLAHQLPVPEGVNDELMRQMESMVVKEWWEPYQHSKELCRLSLGRFMAELHEQMVKASGNEVKKPKLAIYSGHDSTVAPILCAFDIFDNRWPPFAANIIFELLEDNELVKDKQLDLEQAKPSNIYVRIKYNDKIFKLPNCQKAISDNAKHITTKHTNDLRVDGTLCPLWRFSQLVEQVIPKDFEQECKIDSNVNLQSNP